MRVVLDTNVIVSGLIVTDSLPNRVLAAGETGLFELVVSPLLLSELRNVLLRPYLQNRLGWADDQIWDFVSGLREIGQLVEPVQQLHVLMDEADNRFLEAGVAGEAEYIVTGDAQLLALAKYEGIQIVTPAQFVAILAALPL